MSKEHRRHDFSPEVRNDVKASQHDRCADCGKVCNGAHRTRRLYVHHVLPDSQGGSNERQNGVGLCERCHQHHDREALCNGKLFYEVLMEEGRWTQVRKMADLAGIPQPALASPDRLRDTLKRKPAPYYPQIEMPANTAFYDEANGDSGGYFPLADKLKGLLDGD